MSDDAGAAEGSVRERAAAPAFGDRRGLLLFLASLALSVLVWRVGFLINDSYTLANGLVALERGRLAMTAAEYGPGLLTPGAFEYRGAVYARNYGALVGSLPFLAAVRAVGAVADLRIAVAGGWSLLVLGIGLLLGREFDRERAGLLWGAGAALALFAGNVALARPFPDGLDHLVALQLFHLVVAAFVPTFAYRLAAARHGRRTGTLAGVLVLFGTPLSFWAAVPKRHVIAAAVVLAAAYALASARAAPPDAARRRRGAAYALVGLFAWVHAPEALLALVALALADLPAALEDPRGTLAVVAPVFLVSLVPFLATNQLIAGDPLTPPRLLARTAGGGAVATPADVPAQAPSDSSDIPGGVGGLGALVTALAGAVPGVFDPVARFGGFLVEGLRVVVDHPDRIYRTFVRSGGIERTADRVRRGGTNLAVVESVPLLAGTAAAATAAVVTGVRSRRREGGRFGRHPLPRDPSAALLVAFSVALALTYAARLPVHAQVTVRYLFPIYPIGAAALACLPPLRDALSGHARTFAWTCAGGILIGGQLALVALLALGPTVGEAFQLHALLGLALALVLAAWTLGATATGRGARTGAALVGLATAAAAVFVLLVAVEYYPLAEGHALPVVRAVARRLAVV